MGLANGAGLYNGIVHGKNVDFSRSAAITATITAIGQVMVGCDVEPNIRILQLVEGAGISFTYDFIGETLTVTNTDAGTSVIELLGTVTSVIDFDINFVSLNSIVATVNSTPLAPVVFLTDQATTISALAARIATATGVTSATVTNTKEITVVFTSTGNNTVNSVVTSLGATQPVATITEQANAGTLQTNVTYIMNNNTVVVTTLPTVAAQGKSIKVLGKGSGGWKVLQNASQQVHFGNKATTVGATGFYSSTDAHDCANIINITANNIFTSDNWVGNINGLS